MPVKSAVPLTCTVPCSSETSTGDVITTSVGLVSVGVGVIVSVAVATCAAPACCGDALTIDTIRNIASATTGSTFTVFIGLVLSHTTGNSYPAPQLAARHLQ